MSGRFPTDEVLAILADCDSDIPVNLKEAKVSWSWRKTVGSSPFWMSAGVRTSACACFIFLPILSLVFADGESGSHQRQKTRRGG